MHMHTHGRQTMMTETSKTTNFEAYFLYKTFFIVQQFNSLVLFSLDKFFPAG